VDEAREETDHGTVERVGMDETSSRKGHNYITLFYDLDNKQLLFGTKGRKQDVVREFAEDLEAYGGDANQRPRRGQ